MKDLIKTFRTVQLSIFFLITIKSYSLAKLGVSKKVLIYVRIIEEIYRSFMKEKACVYTQKSTYLKHVGTYTPFACLYGDYVGSGYGSVQFGWNLPPKYGSDYGSVSELSGIPWILEHQK